MPHQHVEIIDGREYVVTTLVDALSDTQAHVVPGALAGTEGSAYPQAESCGEEAQTQSGRSEAHAGLTGGSGPPPSNAVRECR